MIACIVPVTICFALTAMVLIDGVEGEFSFALGAVVAAMLLGSWITALHVLPYLCAVSLRPGSRPERGAPVRGHGWLVRRLLSLGLPLTVLALAAVGFSATQFARLKPEMFPFSERADSFVYMDLPKVAAISRTEGMALRVQDWPGDSEQNPGVLNSTAHVGDGGPRFDLGLDPADPDPASAFFQVNAVSLAAVEAAFADLPDLVRNEGDWGNEVIKVVVDIAQDKAREFAITSRDVSEVMDAYF